MRDGFTLMYSDIGSRSNKEANALGNIEMNGFLITW